ncbi:MAG TPA: urate oxidase [Candidatus Limnocylindria bacterium]|nr:urate oxidase [Candidatus Limnocylindria bacterium]
MTDDTRYEIRYGKAAVNVYRTYGAPLTEITPVPESPYTGRDNTLMAAEIEIQVRGQGFLESYTEGDNRQVVATDTMKNFIHAASASNASPTLEGWIDHVGRAFLEHYPQMERITMLGRELPYPAATVPADDGDGFVASEVLFARDRNDQSTARLDLELTDDRSVRLTDHACGREGLQLVKITGSSFADFARDEHTTLPERPDRALFTWMDIGWKYTDATDALGADASRYVAGDQVADMAGSVFHEFVSLSIQHLVHEIGGRILDRWPQLAEVSFEAQNRTWDPGATSPDNPKVKTYADPRPPVGRISLVMRRG